MCMTGRLGSDVASVQRTNCVNEWEKESVGDGWREETINSGDRTAHLFLRRC